MKCPRHPHKGQLLVPTGEVAEHTIIDLCFTKNGCRKTITKYVGERAASAVGPPRNRLRSRSLVSTRLDVAYDEAALAVGLADTTFFHATFTDVSRGWRFCRTIVRLLAYQARSIRGYNAFLRAARATGAGCDRLIWARIAALRRLQPARRRGPRRRAAISGEMTSESRCNGNGSPLSIDRAGSSPPSEGTRLGAS